MHGAARGEQFESVDISAQNARVAIGEAGGRAAALLELLTAGGGPGIDQDIADAELFDEAEGFLFRARADGEHSNDGADTEDDAQSGEQGASLLGPQIGQRLSDVTKGEDHFCRAFMAPFWGPESGLLRCSGLDIATTSPSLSPLITAWLSLRFTKATSCGMNPCWVRK